MIDRNPPILTTARLTLTPTCRDDFDDSLVLRSDPEVMRFIGGVTAREDVWSRMLRCIGQWTLNGFGCFAARETATGRFVGEIGFFDYQRDTTPSFAGVPEAGWATEAWCHGRGFASEAVAVMLAWGDAQEGFERTVAMIAPENNASVRLATKFGYRPYAATAYKDHAVTLFERLRPK